MPATSSVSKLTTVNSNPTATAIQCGPYTKSQFQSTIEGSRTIKSSKEIEQLLHDYPAALELYRTGKYKVKVKRETDIERVILVEKRTTKSTTNNSKSSKNNTQENNQTVPDDSNNVQQVDPNENNNDTQLDEKESKDRVATSTVVKNNNNLVQTTISSIRLTSNTQPKVDHHRASSNDREVSVTPSQKQAIPPRSHSRDIQQTTKMNQDYQNMISPFVRNPVSLTNPVWPQRTQQPYYNNPLLQTPQRTNSYISPAYAMKQNSPYVQSHIYGQNTSSSTMFPHQQSGQPIGTMNSVHLHSTTHSTSSQSGFNSMKLPPSFRTFHANQQPIPAFRPLYQPSVQLPSNPSYQNITNDPIGTMVNDPSYNSYADLGKGARNRARSVDIGHRFNAPVYAPNVRQPAPTHVEHYHHYHRHHHHHQQQQQQQYHQLHSAKSHVVVPATEHAKNEEAVQLKDVANFNNPPEKLTARQLEEIFLRTDPSGRVPYNSLPVILQRFGITLTEHDVFTAAKELQYSANENVSARRLIRILIKLGKITKSSKHQHRPVSPSMLPEDREVTDIMTQN